jgi:hypothetical protein
VYAIHGRDYAVFAIGNETKTKQVLTVHIANYNRRQEP